MKRVAIYYRVSTERQDLDSQKQAVETWLRELPDDKKPLGIEVFSDTGISGKTSQRPGYEKMLKKAFARQM